VSIDQPSDKATRLKHQYAKVLSQLRSVSDDRTALVINGKMLEESLLRYPEEFKQVFDAVDSIICNRAAPAQKALVVR